MLSVVWWVLGGGSSEGSLAGHVHVLNVDGSAEGSVVEKDGRRLGVNADRSGGGVSAARRGNVVDPLTGVHGQGTGSVADGTGDEDGRRGRQESWTGKGEGAWAVAGAGEEGRSWTGEEDLSTTTVAATATVGLRDAEEGGEEDNVLCQVFFR